MTAWAAIVIGLLYLLALVTSRVGRRRCAVVGLVGYWSLFAFETIALRYGWAPHWFFIGCWVVALLWFVGMVRLTYSRLCSIAAFAIVLLDAGMVWDAIRYPKIETELYLNYEYIAGGLHGFMLMAIWSYRGVQTNERRSSRTGPGANNSRIVERR